MEVMNPDPVLTSLHQATTNIQNLLQVSMTEEGNLTLMDKRLSGLHQTLSAASETASQLQSLSMASKALDSRINRAVSPALTLLHSFRRAETLQRRLLVFSASLPAKAASDPARRLPRLMRYVDTVDRLNAAVEEVSQECNPALQKLQEVVEFLSRTKATDQFRTHRLTETLAALKALYETEVDAMKYEGVLDEALLSLQDEYEKLLQQLMHRNIGDQAVEENGEEKENHVDKLGSDLEIEVLRRISETLTRNDCLDICIDIFVKVRYKRAAKALMRLNPDYLKTYTPEEIDELEWETLETAITMWTQHFELAVKKVLVLEKQLCNQVQSNLMEGMIWCECFVKIADKIMAVFFRFGEGVARSSREPQKLFKLLDMYDSLEKMKPEFVEVFEGEAGADICSRFRELEKLLIHASSKVFWEFGLRIESNQDGLPPPQDGSVPKLVRYVVNYLKYLTSDQNKAAMAKVLKTEQAWKMGVLSRPENEEVLLKDAIANVMEALHRNVEAKKSRYRDKVLPHIFSMNTYWYIYMRSRNTELGKVVGEQWLKTKFKTVAEESAYSYQKNMWGPVVRHIEMEPTMEDNEAKLQAFMRGVEENMQKHRNGTYSIPDMDLRVQIREAAAKLVVPTFAIFVESCSRAMVHTWSWPTVDMVQDMLSQAYEVGGTDGPDGRARGKRAQILNRRGSSNSMDGSYDVYGM